ncbi:MAG TPA: hemerythrin domain-containing protein [Trebonia sp.]|nr:hemerythrin domain-containing protein [Trebonia sp.]
MESVFDVLSKDHQQVMRMLAELETGPTAAAGADAGQLSARKKMVEELIIEESGHEAAEEMYFWPVVRERHPNGEGLADAAIAQEKEAKKALDLLDKLAPGLPEFEGVLARFTRAAREHILFEEASVWPGLADALSAQEAADLGQKLHLAKKSAPTRPHPGTPAHPGILKGAGPAVAAADRLRDAVSRRGQD